MNNGTLNSKEIAILVLSFDGFQELWKPFFDYFFTAWDKCPYKIYLLNNFEKYDDDRIINLLVGKDTSWSDSLKKGLEKITEKRVFFLYDDAFIYKIERNEIQSYFQSAILNNYTSVMLRPSLFINQFSKNKLQLIPQKALYRNALFCNLIERKHLINMLQAFESAWDFELKGNKRSENHEYYSTKKISIYYHHGIVKGKWFYSIYQKLTKEGYSFEKLDKRLTFIQSFQLKLRIFIYETFLRITPLKLVRKIENKRKKNIYD